MNTVFLTGGTGVVGSAIARALLVESSMAIVSVAEASGFSSVSQFYAQFKQAYGVPPAAVREQYLNGTVAG